MTDEASSRPLRVLIVHAPYLQRGGEDVVVEAETELLRRHGHEVELHLRANAELVHESAWRQVGETIWSRRNHEALAQHIRKFRPEIVHVHNTFAALSPSIYSACDSLGVPVVQTLHNFRLACPQAMLLREDRPCEDCVGRVPWRSIVHGCYQGSRAKSAVISTMLVVHRAARTWSTKVATFIALNEFCRSKFIAAGLPAERILVKPNFADLPAALQPVAARSGFLFVGRLSPEKGISTLAQAVQRRAVPLHVIGEGPSSSLLDELPGVTRLGPRPRAEVFEHMQKATALVLPSIWYENMPMVLVEAFANGLPVIASRLGAMAELIEHGRTGLLVAPNDPDSLAEALQWAADHPQAMAELGHAARQHYERVFSPDVNHRMLTDIYRATISRQPRPTFSR